MDEKNLTAEDLRVVEDARRRVEGAGAGRLLLVLLALAFGAVAAWLFWIAPAGIERTGPLIDGLIDDLATAPQTQVGQRLQLLVDGAGWLLTALVWLALGTAGRGGRRRDEVLVKLAGLRARDLDLPLR